MAVATTINKIMMLFVKDIWKTLGSLYVEFPRLTCYDTLIPYSILLNNLSSAITENPIYKHVTLQNSFSPSKEQRSKLRFYRGGKTCPQGQMPKAFKNSFLFSPQKNCLLALQTSLLSPLINNFLPYSQQPPFLPITSTFFLPNNHFLASCFDPFFFPNKKI
jgi:hypothetical protein